jgi:nicotinic acid mononucleotide adenylyltransferase
MAVFVTAILLFAVSRAPSLSIVRAQLKSSDRAVLDRHQQIIDEVRVEKSVRRLGWVELSQVSPAFIEALLQPISSREIRRRVASGEMYRYYLAPEVYEYIETHHLYR